MFSEFVQNPIEVNQIYKFTKNHIRNLLETLKDQFTFTLMKCSHI